MCKPIQVRIEFQTYFELTPLYNASPITSLQSNQEKQQQNEPKKLIKHKGVLFKSIDIWLNDMLLFLKLLNWTLEIKT